MWFQPYYDMAKGCASYLLADEVTGQALVIDPLAAVGAKTYLSDLAERGLRLTHVLETHLHADHLSAGRELAHLAGASLCLGQSAQARFPFVPLSDGETLRLGGLDVTVRQASGHTVEDLLFFVADLTRSPQPWMVFTGDILFVGDVGRPDLMEGAGISARQQALFLYDTLHRLLLPLPDAVEIYPTHFGASACGGAGMSRKPVSTIGYERLYNRNLSAPSPEAFVEGVLAGLKPPPEGAATIRTANTNQPLPEERLPVVGITPWAQETRDELVVDLRPLASFLEGYIPGSLPLPYSRDITEGMKGQPRRPLLLLAESPGTALLAAKILEREGWEVRGRLAGDLREWEAAGRLLGRVQRVDTEAFYHLTQEKGERVLLDVRPSRDRQGGTVPGSRHLPVTDLLTGGPKDLDPGQTVVAFCNGGSKAAQAAASLAARGFRDVMWVDGGMTEWIRRGYPREEV